MEVKNLQYMLVPENLSSIEIWQNVDICIIYLFMNDLEMLKSDFKIRDRKNSLIIKN
jgi:hypothetical protein